MSEEVLHPKKRNRLTLACTICKKRKVKCDRGKPCTSCIRYNVAKACEYQEPVWLLPENDLPSSLAKQETNYHSSPIPSPMMMTPQTLPNFNLAARNYPHLPPFDPTRAQYPLPPPPLHMQHNGNTNDVNGSVYQSFQYKPVSPNIVQQTQPMPTFERIGHEPVIQTELDKLKDKIKQIEASVTVANMANTNESYTPNSSQTYTASLELANTAKVSGISFYNCAVNNYQIYHTIKTVGRDNPMEVYGFNPVYSTECSLNFFDNYIPVHVRESRIVNHGPLSWMSISKKDPAMFYLWEKVLQYKKERKLFPHDCSSKSNRMDTANSRFSREEEFRNRMLENEGIADLQPYINIKENTSRKPTNPKKKLKESVVPQLSHHGRVESELEFIKRIEVLLPKQKIIWLLLDRFFRYTYPFMPFIDEADFRISLSKIIGPRGLNDSKIEIIKVEKRYDFATIGILFIALRFGFISLVTNNPSVNEMNLNSMDPSEEAANMRYLLEHPVRSDIINAAQMCLNQFKLLRKSSLIILQCSLYMRLYHLFAPEDGDVDGSDGGQVFTSMLIQMANTIGLNRDPEKFKHLIGGEKAANLWRKIWYQLVALDRNRGGILGSPMVTPDLYDTELPFYLASINENSMDPNLEKRAIEVMSRKFKIIEKMTNILRLVLNLKTPAKLVQLTEYINEIEIYANDNLKSLSSLMTPFEEDDPKHYIIDKVSKVRQYIHLRVFVSLIHYHLFLYYEQRNNIQLAFFYLKKLLIGSCIDILPNIFNLLLNSKDYFGIGYDFYLTPIIEHCFQNLMHINVGLIVRTKYLLHVSKFKSPSNVDQARQEEFRKKVESLNSGFIEISDKYIHGFMKISNRYYYAWRMSKAKKYILSMVRDDNFFSNNFANDESLHEVFKTNIFSHCDSEQIDQLVSIVSFGNSEHNAPKAKKYHCGEAPISVSPQDAQFKTTTPNGTMRNDPGSSSNSTSQYSVNEAEIDQIWYEMLASSNQSKIGVAANGVGNSAETAFDGSGFISNNFNPTAEMSFMEGEDPFHIFGDLSFDHIFN